MKGQKSEINNLLNSYDRLSNLKIAHLRSFQKYEIVENSLASIGTLSINTVEFVEKDVCL